MAKWPKVKLADCVNLLAGFPFKSQQFTDKPEDVPLVKGENVSQGCILWEISKRWPASDWENMEKFHLVPGDVVIAMDRPWIPAGLKWSYIRAGDPKALLVQRCARLRSTNGRLDQNFLRFVIGSPGFEGYVKPITTGVNVPHISGQQILDYEFTLPPLPVQRRIAGILSAYDELMENSQRRIRILEAMARALYREWFIHFRYPGSEPSTRPAGHPSPSGRRDGDEGAQLVRFPGSEKLPSPRGRRAGVEGSQIEKVSRISSPLGDIPKGWECIPLSNFINVTHGYAFQGAHFSEEPTSRVLTTPGNFLVGGGIKYDKLKFYQEDAPLESAYVFEPMDLMLTMTDLSKAGDTLGYPAFVPRLNGLTFLHNQRVGKVVPLGNFFPKHFLYCLFCDERYRHHIVGGATGTSVKHTSPTRILGFVAAMPKDRKLIHAFDEFARPVFEQIGTLIEALQNLRRTRDLLLPRLLSGQVELKSEAA